MSKIVTLKEGNTEIYPVTSAEAIFDKVKTGNIQDGAVTTIKVGDSAITNIKLASNAVTTPKIADKAVTYGKIDGSTTQNLELLYSYVQPSDASSTIDIDVPIDLTVYKYLQLNVFYEAAAGTSAAWGILYALDGSKGNINCRQCGIEADNTTSISGINRENPQLIAAGVNSASSTSYDVMIQCGNDINFPIAFCRGFGGNQRFQVFSTRILTNPPNFRYIRVPLYNPTAGSRIILWGMKRGDIDL